MIVKQLHDWELSPAEARNLQIKLADNVIKYSSIGEVQYIAGVDVSILTDNAARAAIVTLSYPALEVVEVKTSIENIPFPYIPGLLSFREIPPLASVLSKLSTRPDIIFVDGQGIAHPRGLGLASHLGLLVDIPTIGCAKSLLCGVFDPVGEEPGEFTNVVYNKKIIGVALRTKKNSKPLIISIGHKIDLQKSINWVMKSCTGYKLPEPTRLAHLASIGKL